VIVMVGVAAAIAVVAALGLTSVGAAGPSITGVTISLVDAKNHDEPVTGSPPQTAPGAVVAIKVSATLQASETWRSTSYAFGGASATCVDTGDHTRIGSYTEYVTATMPEQTPSPARLIVRLYPLANCAGGSLASPETAFAILTPTPNPVLLPHCDTRVALVLDESGSIGTTPGATQAVRNGAKAFVNGLVDSGAQLAVVDFSTAAETVPLGSPAQLYNNVTEQFAAGPFNNYITGKYNPGGYTNWQDALLKLSGLNPKPEFVVLVTDGDPTARNTATGTETGFPDGSYSVMDPAFTVANQLKASGVHMFAMGVGAALTDAGSQVRLRAISGPVSFPEHPLVGSDYTIISDFQQLQDALATIGRALCSIHVDVTKLVDQTGDGTYAPENAWDFRGTITTSGASNDSYRWFAPGVVTGPPSGGNSRIGTTANDFAGNVGRTTFAWKPSPITLGSQIALTDVGRDGYHFSSVSCTKNGAPITVGATPAITIDGLALNDEVACVFKDQVDRGQLRVAKHFVGRTALVSLLIDADVKKTSADQDFATEFVTVSADTHQVSEEFDDPAQAALYDSSYVCRDESGNTVKSGNGTIVAGGVPIGNSDKVTCTFTNQKRGISVWVGKLADPSAVDEPGGEVRFTATVVNTTDAPVTLTSLRDDVYGNLDSTSSADDHAWISSACATEVPLAAYDGQIGGVDTYSCSFVGNVTGAGGSSHKDTVEAEITDSTGDTATATATATVDVVDVSPAISVTKSARPSIVQDRGVVTFTAVVTNTSPADPLVIDRLSDSIYGDLINGPVKASCTLGDDTGIALPYTLPMGGSLICSFQVTVSASQTDTITASGTDQEGNRVEDAGRAAVLVLITPPPIPPEPPQPPLPPEPAPEPSPEPAPPAAVLSVSKTGPASVYLNAAGAATFAYDIRVRSTNGTSTDTTLVDPAPKGARFTRVTRRPNPGSCSIVSAGKALSCRFGDLVAGQSVGIGVQLTVRATGGSTVTNTATASCQPAVPAPCTAKASAKTRLLAPFLPPARCTTILANPQSLVADGLPQGLKITLRKGSTAAAGVTVVLTGPGIHRTGNTGSTGVFRTTLKPQTAGRLRIGLRGAKPCSAGVVGIVAAGTPPLTG
jgi:von Willebrand factor type A domain